MFHIASQHRMGEHRKTKPNQAGFNLVELMVAMLILSMGILGASSVLTTANLSDRKNKQLKQAEAVALSVVEQFSAGNPALPSAPAANWLLPSYSDFPSGLPATGNFRTKGGYRDLSVTDSGYIFYRWTSTPDTNLQRLDIIVGYGKTPHAHRPSPRTVLERFASRAITSPRRLCGL
jgi:prepilin-type N-terminal cleavage/methylation domain-containing protein